MTTIDQAACSQPPPEELTLSRADAARYLTALGWEEKSVALLLRPERGRGGKAWRWAGPIVARGGRVLITVADGPEAAWPL